MKEYLEIYFVCPHHLNDILMAEISYFGIDAFEEKDDGFIAYSENTELDISFISGLTEKYKDLSYQIQQLPQRNWNEQWEENYEPVYVDDQCYIRAYFHPEKPEYPYQINIVPKMSFGTGHHSTTYLMVSHMLELPIEGKQVMDVGCGTGILSIMAEKLGASRVDGIDIGDWCIENSLENFKKNNCRVCTAQLGTIEDLKPINQYDILIANITRNVLLEEMHLYHQAMKANSYLLLSGFFEENIPEIQNRCEEYSLSLQKQKLRNNWAGLLFFKK